MLQRKKESVNEFYLKFLLLQLSIKIFIYIKFQRKSAKNQLFTNTLTSFTIFLSLFFFFTKTLKDNKHDGRLYVPMPGEKNNQDNTSHLSQSLIAIIVSNLSLSSVYPDSDKLLVDVLGQNYFVDRNVLGHITGTYSRRNLVVKLGGFSDETNNQIRDKMRQTLIAEQHVDACRSLILARNSLVSLNKLNGNVLNDILQRLSKTCRKTMKNMNN